MDTAPLMERDEVGSGRGWRGQQCLAGHVHFETPSGHPSGDVREMAGMPGPQGKGGDGDINGKVISTEIALRLKSR